VPSHSRHAVVECIGTTHYIWVYHNTPETELVWEDPRFPRSKNLQVLTSADKVWPPCVRTTNVCW
jgi:hypothetical protein